MIHSKTRAILESLEIPSHRPALFESPNMKNRAIKKCLLSGEILIIEVFDKDFNAYVWSISDNSIKGISSITKASGEKVPSVMNAYTISIDDFCNGLSIKEKMLIERLSTFSEERKEEILAIINKQPEFCNIISENELETI